MAAVVEADSTLVFKCMEFCQALASQGQVFNFSLSVGPSFSFSLDTTRSEAPRTKKKPSPSTLRRNARRREEFKAKKQQNFPASTGGNTVFLPSPEKERCPEAQSGLQMSPTHVQREEIVLSEQEGEISSAITPPSPSPVAPSPPVEVACYFSKDSSWGSPRCGITFNCETEFRKHAQDAHGASNYVLENYVMQHWNSVARRRL